MDEQTISPLASAMAKLRISGPTQLTPEEAEAIRLDAAYQKNVAQRLGLNRRTRRRLGLG